MGVEATRTVKIPLLVPDDRVEDLYETSVQYRDCQNAASDFCWPDHPTHPDDLITTNSALHVEVGA